MKKKMVTLVVSVALFAMLAGCGNNKADTASSGAVVKSIETTEETTVSEETSEKKIEEAKPEADNTEEAKPEGEVDVAIDEGMDKYEGIWQEEIAGRGTMEIGPMGDGKYYIEVNWSSSAAEMAVWHFTALYDSASGDLTYDDGSYQMITFDESDNETVTEEKSVHGVLHCNSEGKIEWTDSAYDSDEPSVFVK